MSRIAALHLLALSTILSVSNLVSGQGNAFVPEFAIGKLIPRVFARLQMALMT